MPQWDWRTTSSTQRAVTQQRGHAMMMMIAG
jgi:hypothetical protein